MLSKRIVKYIQSLSHKKLRDEENVFIAEGPKVVAEFLSEENFTCKILCASNDWLLSNKNLLKNILPENIYEIDEISLQKISLLKTPNKVVAVFKKKPGEGRPGIEGEVSLMLDHIQDPGNLGTIIRIADWFGIENVICSENCVDCYNPKVVQATMGSLVRVNVWYTTLIPFIEMHSSISVYAAALSGTLLQDFKKITEGICPECGNTELQWTNVDFQQELPESELKKADKNAAMSDLALVLGSSMRVQPACSLPSHTHRYNRGHMVICNLQKTPYDDHAAFLLRGKTDHVIELLMKHLNLEFPLDPPISIPFENGVYAEELVIRD